MSGSLPAERFGESPLLRQAEVLAERSCEELRCLLEQATEERRALEAEVRQLTRLRDEVDVRLRLAAEGGAVGDVEKLREQLDALRRTEEQLHQAVGAAEERERRLELLLRHLQMSARSLCAPQAGRPYDPWEMALRSQALYGREEERSALAREVHDGPAQLLASVALGLEELRRTLPPEVGAAQQELERLVREVRLGLQEVRRLIYELRPSPVADETLDSQIERYVRDLEASCGAKIELRWVPPPRELAQEEKVAIYRIVQEALRNAIRHARAGRIAVEAFVEPAGWTVQVVDDGIGLDTDLLWEHQEHWGIRGMRERAQLIGAQFRIDSRPGEGTVVMLRLPDVPGGFEGG
ncbi:MAG: sensor histidine kinase [Chloroflexia bacterium]